MTRARFARFARFARIARGSKSYVVAGRSHTSYPRSETRPAGRATTGEEVGLAASGSTYHLPLTTYHPATTYHPEATK
jgi:hypothetical protein